ncbi:hypothetical protein Pnap_4591 (plasmid) [Polaromonas naphthalenivorans CJ2]|uniref:Uncharacterized protein n=1 Tax=Polaromonas naphthalenivorans (strain CJ2) TaxID=365044 RepID=A1VW31_POLNA|nr:hypothetical protein Pnap_4591 [Polaromonas naphthalenivorans CJ2]
MLHFVLFLNCWDVGTGHQSFFGVRVTENHVGSQSKHISHGKMPPVEACYFNNITEPLDEAPLVGVAQKPIPIFIDGAHGSTLLLQTSSAFPPVRMIRHSRQYFAQSFSMGRAAQVVDPESLGGGASLQKSILNRLTQWMNSALSNAQVAQSLQYLPMIRRNNKKFPVFGA